jgi:hypothetical protein
MLDDFHDAIKAPVVKFPASEKPAKTKRESALSRVKRSGLDIVPSKKRDGKIATEQDYASVKFKA